MTPTYLFPAGRSSAASLVLEVVDFPSSTAGFEASSEVGKGEAAVLRQCGKMEGFGAEEQECVEQHYG